jgi:hypothetical protein
MLECVAVIWAEEQGGPQGITQSEIAGGILLYYIGKKRKN